MTITTKAALMGAATFSVAMPLYTLFFLWALDQSTTAAIASSVSPAMISAGAIAWAVHRERTAAANGAVRDASGGD